MNYSEQSIWRFLNTGAAAGAFNMAADEVLARQATVPTLRVYRWQPFTISIGYNQNIEEIDLQKVHRDGVGVVRRPTGGRAIYHAHEVTYSVVIPKNSDWFAKNSLAMYNHISSALVLGLRAAGVSVNLEKRALPDPEFMSYDQKFACFATSARYEIHYDSKKLVGSAQRRFEHALLQHGSILLGEQHLNLLDYLSTNGNGGRAHTREELARKTVCVETILNREVSYDEMVACLKTGFENYFHVQFQNDTFNSSEIHKINQLKSNYAEMSRRVL
jgi:lipoate-protein ligase A